VGHAARRYRRVRTRSQRRIRPGRGLSPGGRLKRIGKSSRGNLVSSACLRSLRVRTQGEGTSISLILSRLPPRLRVSASKWNLTHLHQFAGPSTQGEGSGNLKAEIGIIGGSGLYEMSGFENAGEAAIETPFGWPSDNYVLGTLSGRQVRFWRVTGAGIASLPRS